MFKFDFDIDDAEDIDETLQLDLGPGKSEYTSISDTTTPQLEPFKEIPIIQLIDALPTLISYSPLSIPLSSSRKSVTLIRRDLFDARFQLISEGAGDAAEEATTDAAQDWTDKKALGFLDAPSDLVPGVYEGGLKTWECSLDLVDHLDSLKDKPGYTSPKNKMVLELGCGTGVPSMYILRELLSSEVSEKPSAVNKTELHLQDYNASVLQLVTLPNLFLTWYTSPQGNAYRDTTTDAEIAPFIDLTTPGELPITPELKSAFIASLQQNNIALRFFCGAWDTFDPIQTSPQRRYNILLTSETIYRVESLKSLISLMQAACLGRTTAETLDELVSSQLQIGDSTTKDGYLCIVAAKVLYFGVGGGIPDFLNAVGKVKGRVETVLERNTGVGRKVMAVQWS